MQYSIYAVAKSTSPNFGRELWKWHAIYTACFFFAPEISAECENWHCNFSNKGGDAGGELSEIAAKSLSKVLTTAAANGKLQAYIERRDAELAARPGEPCYFCKLDKYEGREPDEFCELCEARGGVRYWEHRVFTEAHILEFSAFLDVCGGFRLEPSHYSDVESWDQDEFDEEEEDPDENGSEEAKTV